MSHKLTYNNEDIPKELDDALKLLLKLNSLGAYEYGIKTGDDRVYVIKVEIEEVTKK